MTTQSPYDPFSRGPEPVGVRTFHVSDDSRERTLPVEVWYPAAQAYAGQDLEPEHQDRYKPMQNAPEASQAAVRDAEARGGRHALIVFSHGFGGERRQTTHFCTHLASHGYAVVSMDHIGNTMKDTFEQAVGMQGGAALNPAEAMARFIEDRPRDARFVIDRAVAGDAGVEIDAERIGMTGHSFGGWTTLATADRDHRVRAALPLAPAGGPGGVSGSGDNRLAEALAFESEREIPTLFLVADLDTLLPLEGMRQLIDRTPAPCRAVVLKDSDHFHFCDDVERVHDMFKTLGPLMGGPGDMDLVAGMKASAELCPGEHAYAMIRGLGLAHMDAHVRGSEEAAQLTSGDLAALLRERGVEATCIR